MPSVSVPFSPQYAANVRLHNLGEDCIGEPRHRPEIRIHCGIADQRINAAPVFARLGHQRIDIFAPPDVAGDGDSLASLLAQRRGDGFTSVRLTARNHDLCSGARESFGDRAANPSRRPRDDRDISG